MGGRPLPLLGRFHEFSVAVDDVRAAVEFYERLGFSHATTTDTYSHPYGVLTDGSIFIGLHQRATPSPVLTFVRSGVAGGVAELAAAGIELSVCRTGEEVFNEIAFSDPDGHAVAVLEARTYSPVVRGEHEPSLCGNFAEVSLPVADFAVAQAFWEGLGLVVAAPCGFLRTSHARVPRCGDGRAHCAAARARHRLRSSAAGAAARLRTARGARRNAAAAAAGTRLTRTRVRPLCPGAPRRRP
jgi:catechol 2,3-dioxygenase-like lactoylglutathione lyase family enzyme